MQGREPAQSALLFGRSVPPLRRYPAQGRKGWQHEQRACGVHPQEHAFAAVGATGMRPLSSPLMGMVVRASCCLNSYAQPQHEHTSTLSYNTPRLRLCAS